MDKDRHTCVGDKEFVYFFSFLLLFYHMWGPLETQTQTHYPNDELVLEPYFPGHNLPIHFQPYIPIPIQPIQRSPKCNLVISSESDFVFFIVL